MVRKTIKAGAVTGIVALIGWLIMARVFGNITNPVLAGTLTFTIGYWLGVVGGKLIHR